MHRHRPNGWLRHYAGFLSPNATTALRVLLERDREQRLQRLAATVRDIARERQTGSRPRMRALQAAPGARLRWCSTAAPPAPGPHGAVVHPIASATCDIDCPLALGRSQFALPLHLGHECVADVLSVGERVSTVKPGDRVIVPFEISCGECAACLAGLQGSCASVPPVSAYGMGLATGHWGGAFSDELAVPYADAMLVPLPDGIAPAAAASLADNVCDAYRHIGPHVPALLERDPDAEILIISALKERVLFSGSVTLYVGLIARAFGARNVCVVDARPEMRAHA
jgi:alcohol dehydrogenase